MDIFIYIFSVPNRRINEHIDVRFSDVISQRCRPRHHQREHLNVRYNLGEENGPLLDKPNY